MPLKLIDTEHLEPTRTDSDLPEFNIFDLLETEHNRAVMDWMGDGDLVGIVAESAGGIVAYCHRNSAERLTRLLMTGLAIEQQTSKKS